MTFVAIDFETANGRRGSACSVGWAVVQDNLIRESGSQLIDPQIPASEWGGFNIGLHGIRPSDVVGAPVFVDVWAHLTAIANGRPFLAHYAVFDVGVIREEHGRFDLPLKPFRYTCSARLAQAAWPGLLSVSLPVVADWLGIELDHHDARSDAETAAKIAVRAVQQLEATDLASAIERARLRWGEVRGVADWTGFGSSPIVGLKTLDQEYEALGIRRGTDPSHPLFGQVVVFTGALQTMTRGEAHRRLYEAGGIPGNSVTRQTKMLVSGDQDLRRFAPGAAQSAKFQKAQQIRDSGCEIELVGEDDFLRLL